MRGIVRLTDEKAVAPVIAEVLLVAITVTISGVLYFTVSNIAIQASVTGRPFVALMPASVRDGVATITVASVSRSAPSASYEVNLEVGGVLSHAIPLPAAGAVATLPVHGVNYQVSWTDLGDAGTLVGGVPITVSAEGGLLPSATSFTFYLIWSDGSVLQTASWTT